MPSGNTGPPGTMPRAVSPAAAVIATARRLRSVADPRTAAQSRRFFKQGESVTLLGVKAAPLREVVARLHREVRGCWSADEAVAFCDAMVHRRALEVKLAGVVLLGRFGPSLRIGLMARARSWVAAGLLDNWAAIDTLCGEVLSPLAARHPDLVPRLVGWARTKDPWLRRAAVVTLVPFARRGRFLPEAYRLVASLAADPEDLMHKACGWLLREAGKTDAARLAAFLERRGPSLARTTVRYAIERFPPDRRRELLASTRGRDRR